MTPSDCHDYLWDPIRSEFVCQTTNGQFHFQSILLAILIGLVVFSFLVVFLKLRRIIELLEPTLAIFQLQGDRVMSITGVHIGGQGTFVVRPVPANASLPTGVIPSWSAGDPSIQLTVATDGLSVVAAVPTGSTLSSFSLSVTVGTFQSTATVPVIADLTGVEIDQTA